MAHLTGTFSGIGVRPSVSAAIALSRTTVRVYFTEKMRPTGLSTPTNYTIVADVGSAARTVLSVVLNDAAEPSAVTLTLDGQLTPGTANYNVAVDASFADFVGNAIIAPLNADFDGPAMDAVIAVPDPSPDFPLDMYKFLHLAMREADVLEGYEFVKRYLSGPNEVWQSIVANLQAIPSLWSHADIHDEHLKYLKHIVGWTEDLKHITDDLDDLALRRLIAASGSLWNRRGPEDVIVDVLSLVTGGTRMRIWNWFDFRWILDETGLGEEHEHNDPWLVDAPSESRAPMYSDVVVQPNAEMFSNLRIVDDGTLDHNLVKNVLRLMRPAGERFDITYIDFLDLFSTEGDYLQWDPPSSAGLVVLGGQLQLFDTAVIEHTSVIVENAATWAEYVYAAKIKGTCTVPGAAFGMLFYHQDLDNTYIVQVETQAQVLSLQRQVAGTPTVIASVNLTDEDIHMYDDVFYVVRVEIALEGATNRIIVFVDGSALINTTDSTFTEGTVGLYHTIDATIECDEVELFMLPVESEILEINQ